MGYIIMGAKHGEGDILLKDEISFKKFIIRISYSLTFIAMCVIYPIVNRFTGRERNLTIFIDNFIPFNRYFVFPYIFYYIYVAGFLLYFCLYDQKRYIKVLVGINTGMLISYLIYLLFPTTVPRPILNQEDGIVGFVFRWLYQNDNPYNCFPSIHVLGTLVIAAYAQKGNEYLDRFVKIIALVGAGLIIYSTLAIKQHVILDAISASVIAFGLYYILEYKDILGKLIGRQGIPRV